jgi:hypothetical protein
MNLFSSFFRFFRDFNFTFEIFLTFQNKPALQLHNQKRCTYHKKHNPCQFEENMLQEICQKKNSKNSFLEKKLRIVPDLKQLPYNIKVWNKKYILITYYHCTDTFRDKT